MARGAAAGLLDRVRLGQRRKDEKKNKKNLSLLHYIPTATFHEELITKHLLSTPQPNPCPPPPPAKKPRRNLITLPTRKKKLFLRLIFLQRWREPPTPLSLMYLPPSRRRCYRCPVTTANKLAKRQGTPTKMHRTLSQSPIKVGGSANPQKSRTRGARLPGDACPSRARQITMLEQTHAADRRSPQNFFHPPIYQPPNLVTPRLKLDRPYIGTEG